MRGVLRVLLVVALSALGSLQGGLAPTARAQEVSVPAYGEGPGASGIATSPCIEVAGPGGAPGIAAGGVAGGPSAECFGVEQVVVTQLPRTGGAGTGGDALAIALLGMGLVGLGCACRARGLQWREAGESASDGGSR